MQWSGNLPNTGLKQDTMTRRAGDRLAIQVDRALAEDPAYQVRTADGAAWICPWSGTVIPCPPGNLGPARTFLMHRKFWTGRGRVRTLHQVLRQKWTLALAASPADPRLRRFADDGRWQHPGTGAWLTLPTARAATDPIADGEIAAALAADPRSQDLRLVDTAT